MRSGRGLWAWSGVGFGRRVFACKGRFGRGLCASVVVVVFSGHE